MIKFIHWSNQIYFLHENPIDVFYNKYVQSAMNRKTDQQMFVIDKVHNH